jgi:hypothetical protein
MALSFVFLQHFKGIVMRDLTGVKREVIDGSSFKDVLAHLVKNSR